MKRLIGIVAVLMLLSITFVSAGSIEDLDYKDRVLFWDRNRVINDHDVEIDADTLDGKSVEELGSTSNYYGSGMSSSRLSDYLTGFNNLFRVYDNLVDYLETIFATKVELEDAHLRMDMIEARLNLPLGTSDDILKETLVIGADRRGEDLIINGMRCVNGLCVKVN